MTYAQNSFSIAADISPVNAPFSSQCMFCAPRPISVPASIADNAGNAMNGGQRIFSTFLMSRNCVLIFETRSPASATVLFIFQFPATTGIRFIFMASSLRFRQQTNGSTRAWKFDHLQDLAGVGGQFPDRLPLQRIHLQAGILHAMYLHTVSTQR